MIVVIDYGMGNLGSVANIIKKVGHTCTVTSDLSLIEKAEKLVLPGVGSFDNGMENLNRLGISEVLTKKVIMDKTPILGICLGAQLMLETSEEGKLPGLNWIKGKVIKFRFPEKGINQRIPHMGWNQVEIKKQNSVFNKMYEDPKFYFVHSYHFQLENEANALTTTDYGYEFASGFSKENITGLQFHPEKSHKYGMLVYKNFLEN